MSAFKDPARDDLRFIVCAIPACLILVFVFYGMEILTSGPFGIHYIRQTDSLSFAAYFRNYSLNLFTPGVLDLRNAPDAGRCAGEFPLIYWCIGMLERLFGGMPLLLKWFNLAVVVTGYSLLVRSLVKLFDHRMLGLGLGLLLFSSGVVAFYACNFLPDAAAYGFVLMGWSLVLTDLFKDQVRPNHWTTLLFVLSGLIKAPMAMHLLAWSILQFVLGPGRSHRAGQRIKGALFHIALLCLVATWHLYARWYNAAHGSDYFLTSAQPLWDMSAGDREQVTELVLNYWWTKYLHPSAWHVLALLAGLIALRFRKFASAVQLVVGLLTAATAAFVVLFFKKLADHDYYFLTIMPVVVVFFVAGLWSLFQMLKSPWLRASVTVLCWILAIGATDLAHTELGRRMDHTPDRYSRTAVETTGLAHDLNVLELPTDARIIVVGDSTTNGALLVAGRLGWSYPGFPIPATVALEKVVAEGATHIIYIGKQEQLLISAEPIGSMPGWSLWRINR